MKDKLVALIVDDSKLIAERLLDMLVETRNVQHTILGHSFEEGKKMLEENTVDVVLLDINLPDKSGIELLRFINKTGYQAKVIMVTNETNHAYRDICLKLGAHEYVDKSNEFEKLLGIIEKL